MVLVLVFPKKAKRSDWTGLLNTTSDGFAIHILDPVISNLGTECLHHLAAEPSVYLTPVGIIGSLLENKPDDLN